MAIERGEALGLLKVFIEFENILINQLIDFCQKKWNRCQSEILVNCVRMAYNNVLRPSLEDYIRWELRHSSHMTALDVFRTNVKYLLLEPPLKGEYVIGVDPGHLQGYKVALGIVVGMALKSEPSSFDSLAVDGSSPHLYSSSRLRQLSRICAQTSHTNDRKQLLDNCFGQWNGLSKIRRDVAKKDQVRLLRQN